MTIKEKIREQYKDEFPEHTMVVKILDNNGAHVQIKDCFLYKVRKPIGGKSANSGFYVKWNGNKAIPLTSREIRKMFSML